MSEREQVEVRDNESASRYEATVGTRLAGVAHYRRDGDVITFPHTVVEPEFEGRGIGSALARRSLDDARAAGLRVVPLCSFYAGWIAKHPDYADLVAS